MIEKNVKFQEIKSAKHQKIFDRQRERKKSIFVFLKRPKWELEEEEEDSDISEMKKKKKDFRFCLRRAKNRTSTKRI